MEEQHKTHLTENEEEQEVDFRSLSFEKISGEELTEFSLEDILREFGGETGEPSAEPVVLPEETPEEPEELPLEPEQIPVEPEETSAVSGDTVRLDDIHEAVSQMEEPEETSEEKKPDPFSEEWEPEYDAPIGDYIPQEPIIFRPRSRLGELKRQLVAGPEKRYYELSEQGIGRLQITMVLNLLVVLLSAGATVLYGLDMVQPNRMKLMIFGQVLAMLMSGLLGSSQLIEGAADLFKKHFTLNSLLLVTFLACCADGVFCLLNKKVPCCAAFSLEMSMSLWATYHKRVTEIGQMDTLRKATQLDGLVKEPEFFEGRPGILRKECQMEDFMEVNRQIPGPERILNIYALIALGVSVVVGMVAGILYNPVLGVRALAAALLAAVPATAFITISRPMALLEQRLHRLGSVICGWRGVCELSTPVTFPISDTDLFPMGSTRMNGVKFYGDRDPDEVVAYATAVISADGGGLTSIFNQLLDSRNGYHYDVENLQCYGNGGIGGEVCGEPVLVGIQPFLQDMGVEMPEGNRVNQAVYVAIDGELSGVFAITYGKVKSSAAGFTTLCAYRGLSPVLTTGDFMLTESFLRSKFATATKRVAFPERAERAALAAKEPQEDLPLLAMTTKDGLAPMAFAVTGARALRTATTVGLLVHLTGGILGLAMMLILAILGEEDLLTPVSMLIYQLLWTVPGLLLTEWTRSI